MIETDGNIAILKSLNLLTLLNYKRDLKFYIVYMKSNEVGTTLKHPETINGIVKNLSKRIEIKERRMSTFTLRI